MNDAAPLHQQIAREPLSSVGQDEPPSSVFDNSRIFTPAGQFVHHLCAAIGKQDRFRPLLKVNGIVAPRKSDTRRTPVTPEPIFSAVQKTYLAILHYGSRIEYVLPLPADIRAQDRTGKGRCSQGADYRVDRVLLLKWSKYPALPLFPRIPPGRRLGIAGGRQQQENAYRTEAYHGMQGPIDVVDEDASGGYGREADVLTGHPSALPAHKGS
jgi:hypothetical protein